MSIPVVMHRSRCPKCGAIIEALDKSRLRRRLESHIATFHKEEEEKK